MTKGERTRQLIIQKSAPVFNKKGYMGTSLADIQNETGLSRGAIYCYFSDKDELAAAVYQYNYTGSYNHILREVQKKNGAGEKIKSYAEQYADNWKTLFEIGGCPMLNAAVETDDHLHFLADAVRKSIKDFVKFLEILIQQGQRSGEFKAELNAFEYASLLFSIMEGNIMLSKIMVDPSYLKTAAKRVKTIVDHELAV